MRFVLSLRMKGSPSFSSMICCTGCMRLFLRFSPKPPMTNSSEGPSQICCPGIEVNARSSPLNSQILFCISVVFIPIQTSCEEYFFRGYLNFYKILYLKYLKSSVFFIFKDNRVLKINLCSKLFENS